jgi:AcrR family transcriptional regulator
MKPRERILEATISLLIETKDFGSLTVRAIAEKADVGVGLVNYHFKDKESLVRLAVRTFIGRGIIKGYGDRDFAAASARERLILVLRGPMDFLAEHPGISRVSILYDLASPAAGDNGDDSFAELGKAVSAIVPEADRGERFRAGLWAALGAIHEAFLRPELFRERTGLDYAKPEDRSAYAALLADFILERPGESSSAR